VLGPILHGIPIGGRIRSKPYKGIVVKPWLFEVKEAKKAEGQVKAEAPDEKPFLQRAGLQEKGKKGNPNLWDFARY
jgi:hypothetical protein